MRIGPPAVTPALDGESLPITAEAVDVYQDLLRVGPVAHRTFLTTASPRATRALAGLLSSGAVHRDAAGVLHVRPPRAALENWAAQRELEAARARAAAETLSGLYTVVHGAGAAFVEVIEGKDAVRELFRQLQAGAVAGRERGVRGGRQADRQGDGADAPDHRRHAGGEPHAQADAAHRAGILVPGVIGRPDDKA